jgi:hypothetical protein
LNHEKFGRRLVFIETSGIDMGRRDEAIFRLIHWFPRTGVSWSGIIYFDRITDHTRSDPERHLRTLAMFCGEYWEQSVTLITTMWDKTRDSELAERREEDLKRIHWKKMIDKGAAVDRFLNTPDSAWRIVNRVLPRYETKSIQAEDLQTSDLIVVFVGLPGSGKSKMINTLTGQSLRANHSLESTNHGIAAWRVLNHEKFGRRLVFIETPGVDTGFRDKAIFQLISWLPRIDVSLSGIIYLDQIIDPSSSNPEYYLDRLEKLCGKHWEQSVTLVTTMWDKTRDSKLAEGREEDLKKYCWKELIDKGAAVDRFLNTPDSAWKIIDRLVEDRMKNLPQNEGSGRQNEKLSKER